MPPIARLVSIRGGIALQIAVLAALAATLWLAARWLEPLPPRRIVLAAGPPGGYYIALAERYREHLRQDGIELQILATRGAIENLDLLRAEPPGADVAFVQGGVGTAATHGGVEGLGSIFFEPVFVFARRELGATRLADLAGRRIAIGPEGSGTRALSRALLEFNGLALTEHETLPLGGQEARDALRAGRIDAAIFVIAHPLPGLAEMFADPQVVLLGFERADAYRMRFAFLSPVRLPAGSIDLPRDVPAEDVKLVAPVGALVVRDDLHSALKNLLARAARDIHGEAQLFADAGRFPAATNLDYPLNSYARRLIENGPSIFARYLPFWVAVWGERLLILLLPVLGLILPIWRLGPPFYRWRFERRVYRWYRELARLESEVRADPSPSCRSRIAAQLDALQDRAAAQRVPLAFARHLFHLRAHIAFVRDRLERGG